MRDSIRIVKPELPGIFQFTQNEWENTVKHVSKAVNLSSSELEWLHRQIVAKILAALPYYAGCKNPDQLAVAKVAMFVIGKRCPKLAQHRPDQSVRERLLLLTSCPSGDEKIIDLFTSYLEIISINDHISDFEVDRMSGHSNPLHFQYSYYKARRDMLLKEIKDTHPELLERVKNAAWWDSDDEDGGDSEAAWWSF